VAADIKKCMSRRRLKKALGSMYGMYAIIVAGKHGDSTY
jgi:hypothetical protein